MVAVNSIVRAGSLVIARKYPPSDFTNKLDGDLWIVDVLATAVVPFLLPCGKVRLQLFGIQEVDFLKFDISVDREDPVHLPVFGEDYGIEMMMCTEACCQLDIDGF